LDVLEPTELKQSGMSEMQSPSPILRPAFKRFLLELIGFGIVGTGIWVFGEHLANHGNETIGSWINFAAMMSFFAVIPLSAFKRWRSKVKRIWISIGCGIFAVILGIAWGMAMREPIVKVDIGVTTANRPFADIVLTNSFLFRDPQLIMWNTVRGRLLLPMKESAPANVRFSIRSDVNCSEVSVCVFISTNLLCKPGDGWRRGSLDDDAGLYVWMYKTPPILAFTMHALPPLSFPEASKFTGSAFKLGIVVQSKEVRRFCVLCGMVFVSTNGLPKVEFTNQNLIL